MEATLLSASAAAQRNDKARAVSTLQQALSIPVDPQLVQPFVDEGAGLAALYRRLAEEADSPSAQTRCDDLAKRIEASSSLRASASAPVGAEKADAAQSLVDPLSKRELEVLGLVAKGLSNRDIAEQLFVSIDTVKTHMKSIFSKMAVARRTQAVSLGRELNLID